MKKKDLLSILFFLLIILISFNSLLADSTFVSGTIVSQNWSTSGSPYCVVGDLLIASVVIEPGVEVLVLGNYRIEVAGILTAVGTPQDSIVFSRIDTVSSWGGIFFNTSLPGSELTYCHIKYANNSAIRILDSTPLITHCHFSNNSAVSGGAINADSLSISECLFTSNTATGSGSSRGGAIYTANFAFITKCIFNNNLVYSSSTNSSGTGGAVFLNVTSIINNCIFKVNTSHANSGGIYATSTSRGGAIYISGNSTIMNCILSENSSTETHSGLGSSGSRGGGGLCIGSGSVELVNCTIAYNNIEGLRIDGGSLSIMNSILWFNESNQIAGQATVTYCNVEDGFTGTGNIDYNPIFYNAPTCLNVVFPSPCIDSGNPESLYNDPEDPDSLGFAIWPALGTIRNDMGVYGGPGSSSFGMESSCILVNIDFTVNKELKSYFLSQNYPNPFNPITTIEFDLPKTSKVALKVYNILGEEVATLVSEKLAAGNYNYEWDGTNLASGVYLYRLQAESHVETRKMVLMK